VAYHRAAAARARRLLAEATTRWLKEQLAYEVKRHEQILAQIERTPEPGGDEEPPERKAVRSESETPDR
jgi:hypothetical protein